MPRYIPRVGFFIALGLMLIEREGIQPPGWQFHVPLLP
jgi:hypothetical protein